MRVITRMNIGRPKTGQRVKPLNICIPKELVEPAKRYFHKQRGISLSAGITQLLRKELKAEGAR